MVNSPVFDGEAIETLLQARHTLTYHTLQPIDTECGEVGYLRATAEKGGCGLELAKL